MTRLLPLPSASSASATYAAYHATPTRGATTAPADAAPQKPARSSGVDYLLPRYTNRFPAGKSGNGILTRGKSEYRGAYVGGVRWGFGIFVQNVQEPHLGVTYEGKWANDAEDGHGILRDASTHSTYDGHFQNGKKHGRGTLKTEGKDPSTYSGIWQNNRFISGDIVWRGTRYHSDAWRDGYGLSCDNGALCAADGTRYEGPIEGGLRHGEGTETSATRLVYQGSFADDQRHGWGVIGTQKVFYYQGILQSFAWRLHGSDGFYAGEFIESDNQLVPDGNGTFTSENGARRHGVWDQGVPNEGVRWQFHQHVGLYFGLHDDSDKPHGHGTFFYPSGHSIDGIWNHGRVVGGWHLAPGAVQPTRDLK